MNPVSRVQSVPWRYIPLTNAKKRRERRKRRLQRLMEEGRFDIQRAKEKWDRKSRFAAIGRAMVDRRAWHTFCTTMTTHFEGKMRSSWRNVAYNCFHTKQLVKCSFRHHVAEDMPIQGYPPTPMYIDSEDGGFNQDFF